MSLQVSTVHSFILPSNIPLYGGTVFCLFIYQGMNYGLLLVLGDYELCSNEHLPPCLCVNITFHFLLLGHMVGTYLNL